MPAEHRASNECRLRQSLRKDLKRNAQCGGGVALQCGYRVKGCWVWCAHPDATGTFRLARPTVDPFANCRHRLAPAHPGTDRADRKPKHPAPSQGPGHINRHKTGEAIRQFQEALRLKPHYADTRKHLAVVLAVKADSSQQSGASTHPLVGTFV
jgi:hypothetical protein